MNLLNKKWIVNKIKFIRIIDLVNRIFIFVQFIV